MKKYLLSLAAFASVDAFAQSTDAQSVMTRPIGANQIFNPDTSINFLTLYKSQKRQGADKSEPDGGFMLQEAEIQFMANVDAYFRAVAMFAVHEDHDHENLSDAESEGRGDTAGGLDTQEPKEKAYGIEPEEVYLETLAIPYVTLKLGRFHADLGRHNQLHAHAYPFIDAPLINQRLLGEDGLIENGVSASVLVPLPWFAEVSAQALQGDSPELFSSQSTSDVATVYRIRNLFDLTDEATLDFGASAARGHNAWNGTTIVRGADMSLRWRPTQGGKYQSVSIAAEYLQGEVGDRPENAKLSGYSTWVQYQATQRLWLQVRHEEAEASGEGAKVHRKLSGLIGFNPTEFSSFRLQLDQLHDDEEKPLNSLWLQANITIGAHPAHAYN
jgi:hypothetical protein